MSKTIDYINEKIKDKSVTVVRADEMSRIVRQIGPERAAVKVDVVTTGTFGAMCSSGVFLNFGHSDPPIRMNRVWLNRTEAYGGIAAVDAYLGAAQESSDRGIYYGGAHVIEDLVRGKTIELRASSRGTDCYPRKKIRTALSLADLNQAILCNPRNAYQRYNAATNSSSRIRYTYMGKLLPGFQNITFSGSGELSPLMNDPEFKTIGLGSRIFVGGAPGHIIGNGTQHDPENGFATLMVLGDLKKMSAEFIRAAVFEKYGCTLYVGIGVPIPILDADIARSTGIEDRDIYTNLIDYSCQKRNKPVLKRLNYAELKSGRVELNGKQVKTASLSSTPQALKIAELLKGWMKNGHFLLAEPVEPLKRQGSVRPLEIRKVEPEEKFAVTGSRSKKSLLDRKKCIRCGLCVSICRRGVFYRLNDHEIRVEPSRCNFCGACADCCPVQAIGNVSGGVS